MQSLSQLLSLLQLASPTLPIGAFSYSQGLESAIEHGIVCDAESGEQWIRDSLLHVHAHMEGPVWLLLHRCWKRRDFASVESWNGWFHAARESAELRLETEQMGWSLARLTERMEWGDDVFRAQLGRLTPVCLPAAFTAACVALDVDEGDGLAAYCFSWAENQVAAALKAVPLGQVAGQQMLNRLRLAVEQAVEEAMRRAGAEPPLLSTFSPMLGLLSARHETQYSRIFRS